MTKFDLWQRITYNYSPLDCLLHYSALSVLLLTEILCVRNYALTPAPLVISIIVGTSTLVQGILWISTTTPSTSVILSAVLGGSIVHTWVIWRELKKWDAQGKILPSLPNMRLWQCHSLAMFYALGVLSTSKHTDGGITNLISLYATAVLLYGLRWSIQSCCNPAFYTIHPNENEVQDAPTPPTIEESTTTSTIDESTTTPVPQEPTTSTTDDSIDEKCSMKYGV